MIDLARWMTAYTRAWETNDPGDIRALFTPDAEYFLAPHVEPARGHDEIVRMWRDSADAPGDWTFTWEPVAVTETTAVIRGVTAYADGRTYQNLWVMDFAPDGRASRYTEWYMRSDPGAPSGG
jgi:hypothetical protein